MSVREDFKKWLDTQPDKKVEQLYRIAQVLDDDDDLTDEERNVLQKDITRVLKAHEAGETARWRDVRKEILEYESP